MNTMVNGSRERGKATGPFVCVWECSPSPYPCAHGHDECQRQRSCRQERASRTPSASKFSKADGSIPSYPYDLDDEEAAELLGACTPPETDEERNVECAGQGIRAKTSMPS